MRNGAGALYGITDDLNVVDDIKIRRLRWADDVITMEDERIPRKLNRKFHNIRSTGKPRTRWKDVVQRDALQIV